ncbi:hypothetical protein D9619_003288 [Psilocybe cf. subviscida]|uniref:Glycosyltransferase family 31 protein n=1 Tax=Psilocybe cf. subviscida TaxID=2480587 RepID=A0A8H5AY18_9AGAR|nr:hypothetical protein D9619_003288 [Psilocybe cf. subviscida]
MRLHVLNWCCPPEASVPALVVPYENSLSEDVESHRYKSLADVKVAFISLLGCCYCKLIGADVQAIVAFLDKSRSARSHTHSTSSAPAPTLTPATVAASTTCRIIIEDILHSAAADPETLHLFNARDEAALQALARDLLPSLEQRQQTLTGYLRQAAPPGADGSVPEGALRVSEKVKKLWVDQLDAIGLIGAVLADAGKDEAALDGAAKAKRESFFKSAKLAWEGNLVQVLVQLDKEMEGPFALGDQFSIADLHLAGWFTHVVKLAGGTASEDGSTIVKKLEAHIGAGFAFPQNFVSEQARRENKTGGQTKLGAFWDAVRQRPSWKKTWQQTSLRMLSHPRLPTMDTTHSPDSTDSEDTARNVSNPLTHSHSSFLFPPDHDDPLDSADNTPLPSRSTSPLPQFYPVTQSSDCPSDSDSEEPPSSPLLLARRSRSPSWREQRRPWWANPRRRPKRGSRALRVTKRWLRHLLRHPFFPGQPITIVLFAISLTLLLIYVLNPDKEPLPWRAYCSVPSLAPPFDHPLAPGTPRVYPNVTHGQPIPPFPHSTLDSLPPAGVFVGVFSIDSAFERRMLVRSTWASHPRSRNGAGQGDDGVGTSRTIVRFVLGQPRKDWERRVQLEIETYNDIIILPMRENMNDGKTHTFFSWAALSAWVPPIYRESAIPPRTFSYHNATSAPPPLASHDPVQAWKDVESAQAKSWVRPDYVVKVDDDSFVMLAELEARLRLELNSNPQQQQQQQQKGHYARSSESEPESSSPPAPRVPINAFSPVPSSVSVSPTSYSALAPEAHDDPLIFWGYLITNRLHMFMAGELYALSWSLVDWVSKDPTVKTLTWGKEDKQTAKWMRAHPRADEIRWTKVSRVKQSMLGALARPSVGDAPSATILGSSTPAAWAHSSVSTFGVRYTQPLPQIMRSTKHTVEALVEGSDMSKVHIGGPYFPDWAWRHREGRKKRYEGQRVGGTVVVHFIKKNMWYLETALALLEGDDETEVERYTAGRGSAPAHAPVPGELY